MVKETKPMVIWNKRASIYFKNIFDRIKKDSYNNAEKVRDGIIKLLTLYLRIQKNTLLINSKGIIPDSSGLLKNSLTEFHISLLLRK